MGKNQLISFVDLDAEIDKILFTTGHKHAAGIRIVQCQTGFPVQKSYPVITSRHFDTSAVVKVEPDTLKDAVLSNSPSVKAHIGFCSGAVRIVLTAVFINSFATASAVSPA